MASSTSFLRISTCSERFIHIGVHLDLAPWAQELWSWRWISPIHQCPVIIHAGRNYNYTITGSFEYPYIFGRNWTTEVLESTHVIRGSIPVLEIWLFYNPWESTNGGKPSNSSSLDYRSEPSFSWLAGCPICVFSQVSLCTSTNGF